MYARRICIVGRRTDAVPKNVHLPADGFSVLELIVAMGLITVLLALALPAIHNAFYSSIGGHAEFGARWSDSHAGVPQLCIDCRWNVKHTHDHRKRANGI